MLSRSSALILSLTSLSAGVLLGVVLARGGPSASAQVARPQRAEVKAADAPAAPAAPSAPRPEDDAIYDALARQYESFRQVDRTFEMVAKAVSPTVVHIIAKKTVRGEEGRRNRHFEETGSGVIVRSERGAGLYVLTNHHVVENTRPANITVYLRDGRSLLPSRIWSDQKADIAVLKLDRDDLPAARMGNSDDAPVGSWVMALGSPFGLTHSVSQGIISARSRRMEELQDVEYQDFLQTDAAINPGNSGGPLATLDGAVVGVTTAMLAGGQGLGFAIPANLAVTIAEQLRDHGAADHPWIGIEGQAETVPAPLARLLGLEAAQGVLVTAVVPGTPADRAGIRPFDLLVAVGGRPVTTPSSIRRALAGAGRSVTVRLLRAGEARTLEIAVARRPGVRS